MPDTDAPTATHPAGSVPGSCPARQFPRHGGVAHPEGEPRAIGGLRGEYDTLADCLRDQRRTLELTCSGLDAEAMARRAVEPSPLSLLGLVRHLAGVEAHWFRRVMAGRDEQRPYRTEADRDAAFTGAVADPGVVAEAWASWRAEVAFAERFVAGAPGPDTRALDEGASKELRWVLVHMIEEYARHNGHADLLRERIDGGVG